MSKNLVLIGMPGSGKTTIGKLLSKELSYKFIDMDEALQKIYGESVSDMFLKGEVYFREKETEFCKELSRIENTIISTGGGIIKNDINIENLCVNGIIIFINRSVEDILSDIEISTRPLLQDGKEKIYQLYKERYSLYRKYSDIIVENNGSLQKVLEDIKCRLKLR